MWKSLAIKVVIGVVLGWITSLWNQYQERRRNIEEGKKQVKDALEKQKQESDKELNAVINSSPSSFDDAVAEMRKRNETSNNNKT